jgi:hypothetical protein
MAKSRTKILGIGILKKVAAGKRTGPVKTPFGRPPTRKFRCAWCGLLTLGARRAQEHLGNCAANPLAIMDELRYQQKFEKRDWLDLLKEPR